MLLQIDIELAAQSRAGGCQCGGVLHCANYPRKPRACLNGIREDYESRSASVATNAASVPRRCRYASLVGACTWAWRWY